MPKHIGFKAIPMLCAVTVLCLPPCVVLAQVTTGRIVGVITDPSGSRVPDVTVTITQVDTSAAISVTTDSEGSYSGTNLNIGRYEVSCQKTGFQRAIQSSVVVGIGQIVRVDFALKVGVVAQTVEVTGAPPLLEGQTSSLGTIETEQRIVDLPLNGRNFFKLAYLGPGANEGSTGTSAGAGSTDNNRPGMSLSVNGLRVFDNNFLLDGLDNNEFGNGTVVIQPPPDAIEEFRVEENSMDAEFGRGGAMVNLVLRSGTNQFHGAAYEFIRNDKLDARNYFETQRTAFQRNQFGGLLGGPIKKDKMFIFGSIQRTTFREGVPFISTVPTALMRTGNFSETGATLNQVAGLPVPIPAGANTLPAADINPVGQNIVNIFPLPNIPGAGITNNFSFSGKQKFDETAFESRFDYNISANDRFFAHYAIATPISTQPSSLPGITAGAGSGFSSNLADRVQSAAGDWTHIFSPNFVNDARASFVRFRDNTLPTDFGTNAGNKLGIPNADRGGNSSGLTKIEISGYQQLGDSLWTPETIVENVFQLADTMSWTHGKHTIKIGADFRRQQRNFFQQTAPSGQFNFNGQYSGNAVADTLLGIPSFRLQDHLNGEDPTRYWDLSEFVQDNIRVTPNLTINAGLRYEISSPAGGRVGNFDLATAVVNTSSHGGVGFDLKDVAPRLGIAWTVLPKTVVRAGGGIFYAPEGNIFDDLGLNPPNLVALSQNFSSATAPGPGQFVSAGFPATFPTIDPTNPIGTVRTTVTADRIIPRIYEWNLTVQQQLGQNWLVQAAYVASRSTNLFDHESGNYNQPVQPLDSNFSDATGNMGRPYFNLRPGLTTILPLDYARLTMFYNSAQFSAQRRFSGGFNVLAAYTYAKSVGTADGNVQQCDVQNEHDIAAEKGPVTPDFRHRLTVSYVYELPYGKGKHFGSSANGAARAVLGEWQVAGVTTVHSGEAFDALSGNGDLTNTGAASARLDEIHNPQDFSFDIADASGAGLYPSWASDPGLLVQPGRFCRSRSRSRADVSTLIRRLRARGVAWSRLGELRFFSL